MTQLPKRSAVIETLFEKWKPISTTQSVSLEAALGRVLARDYKALYSIPVVRASAMDGVAVAGKCFETGWPDISQWRIGIDFCRADTGDDFDERFDTVIPIESVSISTEGEISIFPETVVKTGMNVRPSGSSIRCGESVGKKDRLLRAPDLACLAMGGITSVEVYARPKVAFLPTGSELVALGEMPQRGKNIDSNSILAKAMLTEMGAEPIIYPIIKDCREELCNALDRAVAEADVIIISGGSSKGEEDFNARILEERGAALFHWVAAAPGKPMCVAVIDNKPVINLPGPPIAMFYGMDWCIRAIINRMLHLPMPKRQKITGELTEKIEASPAMEILCMMDVECGADGYKVKQKPWRGGSMVETLGANAFYITELGRAVRTPGEKIELTLLRDESEL